MRKVDYEILADILSSEIKMGKVIEDAATNPGTKAIAVQRQATAMAIASAFAHKASVNKAAFLAACGITS